MKSEIVTISIEVLRREVPGAVKKVTFYERAIYWMLHSAGGGIVSNASIWNGLYGHLPESDWPEDEGTIRVLIMRLRRKCPGIKIINHHGVGYSMEMK